MVRPILANAVETSPDRAKTRQMLETAEMKALRRILSRWLFDKQRSEDIKEKCGIHKIDDWIKGRRENWYAHVERMSKDRILKKILMNTPAGKRRLAGRVRINRLLKKKLLRKRTIQIARLKTA